MRNDEWPMNVTTAAASSSGGGRCGVTGTCDGHGARGAATRRGNADTGWPLAPRGIEKSPAIEVNVRIMATGALIDYLGSGHLGSDSSEYSTKPLRRVDSGSLPKRRLPVPLG